jgi:hypothetical protein
VATLTEKILIPLTPAMAAEIRRRARLDDRPVAAYVRLLLAAGLSAKGPDAR